MVTCASGNAWRMPKTGHRAYDDQVRLIHLCQVSRPEAKGTDQISTSESPGLDPAGGVNRKPAGRQSLKDKYEVQRQSGDSIPKHFEVMNARVRQDTLHFRQRQ